jgi:hypothetical protein
MGFPGPHFDARKLQHVMGRIPSHDAVPHASEGMRPPSLTLACAGMCPTCGGHDETGCTMIIRAFGRWTPPHWRRRVLCTRFRNGVHSLYPAGGNPQVRPWSAAQKLNMSAAGRGLRQINRSAAADKLMSRWRSIKAPSCVHHRCTSRAVDVSKGSGAGQLWGDRRSSASRAALPQRPHALFALTPSR